MQAGGQAKQVVRGRRQAAVRDQVELERGAKIECLALGPGVGCDNALARQRILQEMRAGVAVVHDKRTGAGPWRSRRRGHARAVLRRKVIAAAAFQDDVWTGRIWLDLAPKPVDVRFHGSAARLAAVAPHSLQQGLARDRPSVGAIKMLQDGHFLQGEPDVSVLGPLVQRSLARTEGVGSDCQHRILAGLVLTDVGAQAGLQFVKAGRPHHMVVSAGIERSDDFMLCRTLAENDDRNAQTMTPQPTAEIGSGGIGRAGVHDDRVDLSLTRLCPCNDVGRADCPGYVECPVTLQGLGKQIARRNVGANDEHVFRLVH